MKFPQSVALRGSKAWGSSKQVPTRRSRPSNRQPDICMRRNQIYKGRHSVISGMPLVHSRTTVVIYILKCSLVLISHSFRLEPLIRPRDRENVSFKRPIDYSGKSLNLSQHFGAGPLWALICAMLVDRPSSSRAAPRSSKRRPYTLSLRLQSCSLTHPRR